MGFYGPSQQNQQNRLYQWFPNPYQVYAGPEPANNRLTPVVPPNSQKSTSGTQDQDFSYASDETDIIFLLSKYNLHTVNYIRQNNHFIYHSLPISRKQIFLVFAMSAPSTTASQTEFCNAMSHVNIASEPASGYDTPIPNNRISEETLKTLNEVKAKLGQSLSTVDPPLDNTSTSQHPICTRLGKCTYCPLIKNRSAIICNFTKKSHQPINLPKQVTCELSNVIYLITCTKCNKHYVGETSRALRKRMYEYKATVLKDGQETPVSRHFKSEGHNHEHMQFTLLEWCTPKFETCMTSK